MSIPTKATESLIDKLFASISPGRVLLAFLGAGSAHLAGVFSGLNLDGFPLLTTSFVTKIWWHFSIVAFEATIASALIGIGLFLISSIVRLVWVAVLPNKERSDHPPYWIFAITGMAWLVVFMNSYNLTGAGPFTGFDYSLQILSAILAILYFAERFNFIDRIPSRLADEMRSLPLQFGVTSLTVIVILGVPYFAGKGLANEIVFHQKFKVWEVSSPEEPYYAVVFEIDSVGIYLRKCDVAGYPYYLPQSSIVKVELNSDPWLGGCNVGLGPLDLEVYSSD